jgi:hypothetical protein
MYSDMCNIGSSFINNVVSGTTTAGYQMHYGWNVTVSSNIFDGGFVAAPGDSVIYANPSPSMGASFAFTNNTVLHGTNATLLSVDLARSNSSKNYTFHGNRYVITSAGRPQFETRGGKADGWGDWLAIGQDQDSTCTDHGAPLAAGAGAQGSAIFRTGRRLSTPSSGAPRTSLPRGGGGSEREWAAGGRRRLAAAGGGWRRGAARY